jgi:hypothetical protein
MTMTEPTTDTTTAPATTARELEARISALAPAVFQLALEIDRDLTELRLDYRGGVSEVDRRNDEEWTTGRELAALLGLVLAKAAGMATMKGLAEKHSDLLLAGFGTQA